MIFLSREKQVYFSVTNALTGNNQDFPDYFFSMAIIARKISSDIFYRILSENYTLLFLCDNNKRIFFLIKILGVLCYVSFLLYICIVSCLRITSKDTSMI